MRKILVGLAITLCSSAACAQYVSGNTLLGHLQSTTSGSRIYTLGYVAGVIDATDGFLVCVPSAVTVGQLRDISEAWILDNPGVRHKPGSLAIVRAVSEHFPCKGNQK